MEASLTLDTPDTAKQFALHTNLWTWHSSDGTHLSREFNCYVLCKHCSVLLITHSSWWVFWNMLCTWLSLSRESLAMQEYVPPFKFVANTLSFVSRSIQNRPWFPKWAWEWAVTKTLLRCNWLQALPSEETWVLNWCCTVSFRNNMDSVDSQSHQKPGEGWWHFYNASHPVDWQWFSG